MRAWVLYSLARLALFAGAFALLFALLGPELWWLSAICGALIALSLSYIFLGPLRERVAADLAARRERRRDGRAEDPDASDEDRESA